MKNYFVPLLLLSCSISCSIESKQDPIPTSDGDGSCTINTTSDPDTSTETATETEEEAEAEAWEGMDPGECSDKKDNDSDNLVDCEDPDCSQDPTCNDDNPDDIETDPETNWNWEGCDPGSDENGDGSPDGFRHWRLLQNSTGAANWFVAEVELWEAPDGPDATDLGGSATAGRFVTEGSPQLAFDNNSEPGTDWALWYTAICCTPVPIGTDYLAWDFGIGEHRQITTFRIKQFDDIQWMYASLAVQSSCDGNIWFDQWIASDLPEDGSWAESSP